MTTVDDLDERQLREALDHLRALVQYKQGEWEHARAIWSLLGRPAPINVARIAARCDDVAALTIDDLREALKP
jgi:hypothetical protein